VLNHKYSLTKYLLYQHQCADHENNMYSKSEKSQNINDYKGDLGESSKRRNKQCFFLQAVVHGAISLSSAVVDGETHRGKLMSPEIWERIEEFLNFTTDGASGTFLLFEP
jgi:hypothetical protein